jgi:hypothetical protein
MLKLLFSNHDLFFWQNIKAYGGSNPFHRYPAVTPKPQFAMPPLGAFATAAPSSSSDSLLKY